MKTLAIALSLIPGLIWASPNCRDVGQREYDKIVETLVLEGKGTSEINDVLSARIDVCRGKCMSKFGLCLLIPPKK